MTRLIGLDESQEKSGEFNQATEEGSPSSTSQDEDEGVADDNMQTSPSPKAASGDLPQGAMGYSPPNTIRLDDEQEYPPLTVHND